MEGSDTNAMSYLPYVASCVLILHLLTCISRIAYNGSRKMHRPEIHANLIVRNLPRKAMIMLGTLFSIVRAYTIKGIAYRHVIIGKTERERQ